MTDEELKELVASLAIAQKRTESELDIRFKEVEAQMAKTDAKLEKLCQLVGNISNNQGDIAEEFFYRSFEKNPVLNNVRFDNVARQLKNCVKGIEDEYDIVLINGDTIAIIEVKAKAHVNDLEKLVNKKMVNFPLLFSMYKDYKRYAGIATLVTNKDLIEKAQELGLFLLTQHGDHAEIVQEGRVLN